MVVRSTQLPWLVECTFYGMLHFYILFFLTSFPPQNPVPGFNYEITNFLQGYIDAEVNLNADGSCALTCGDYQNTKHYACHAGTLCAGLKPENRALIGCKGKVRGCHNLDDDDISVCPGVSNHHFYNLILISYECFIG